ncbi:hypothetical protein SAMN05444344_2401 [Tenacibaculum mesophilum]|uniref:Uncharacterized protein n=2 Tax=Tenacibaculum mesophilum TaxID=104268 RepID=A0ABM7CD51_9FLAO|nr:hypothetical protein D6200_03400 [Tenacibaculum mesophilum]SHG02121.1 hypothetical protein SAMN05444344_2401 [Tenacibaculum mesophilum]
MGKKGFIMRHLKTLVVTKNTTKPKILNWQVSTVPDVETAIEKLHQQIYKVLAISKDTKEVEKNKLQKIITVLFPEAIIVEYKDETALSESVKQGYWSKNKPEIQRNYFDNSFEMELAASLN